MLTCYLTLQQATHSYNSFDDLLSFAATFEIPPTDLAHQASGPAETQAPVLQDPSTVAGTDDRYQVCFPRPPVWITSYLRSCTRPPTSITFSTSFCRLLRLPRHRLPTPLIKLPRRLKLRPPLIRGLHVFLARSPPPCVFFVHSCTLLALTVTFLPR